MATPRENGTQPYDRPITRDIHSRAAWVGQVEEGEFFIWNRQSNFHVVRRVGTRDRVALCDVLTRVDMLLANSAIERRNDFGPVEIAQRLL